MIKLSDIYNSKLILKIDGKCNLTRLSISTDSRSLKECNSFIALNGENFKGASFISDVVSNKISLVVYCLEDIELIKDTISKFPNVLFIGCEDSLVFFQDLSERIIIKWKIFGGTVISITGSNGKTTTKEFLYQYLAALFDDKKIHCTAGNYNNHIGVPLTIMQLKKSHKFLILELGTNHPGEIKFLCRIARPDFGIITSVGKSHLEFFINKENVFKEKIELYKYIKKQNTSASFCIYKKDILVEKTVRQADQVIDKINSKLSNNYIKEDFNKENLYLCFMLLAKIFPQKIKRIKKIYPKIKNLNYLRNNWIKKNSTIIYLDTYNANPSSMSASLQYFFKSDEFLKTENKSLIILGDMNELGNDKEDDFKEISILLNKNKIMNVIFVGKLNQLYDKYFTGYSKTFLTVDALIDENDILKGYNCIFIKGSRSIKLEKLIN